jgi:hypothetical protein
MLKETKQLLSERGRLTLRELAIHFDMDTTAMEPILQRLVDKGQVNLLTAGCGGSPCSGCTSACREDMLMYELAP